MCAGGSRGAVGGAGAAEAQLVPQQPKGAPAWYGDALQLGGAQPLGQPGTSKDSLIGCQLLSSPAHLQLQLL